MLKPLRKPPRSSAGPQSPLGLVVGVRCPLAGLDLKFRNAVRGRLLPGETLRAVAFGPAVWERRFLVLQRRLVAATALAATDWRLLIVEEGEPVRENTYGASAYSIPRSRIADLRRSADGIVVTLRTRGDECERYVPLSRPEDAAPVIDAIAGGG